LISSFQVEGTAMQLGKPATDGQAEPRPTARAQLAVYLIEGLKDLPA
jgi:hypothetical protein